MIFELYPNIFRVVPEIFTSSIQIISILLHDKLLKIRRYFIFLWFKIVDFTDRLLIDNLIMRCPSSVQQCKKRNKSVDDVIRNTFSCFMSTTWAVACLSLKQSIIHSFVDDKFEMASLRVNVYEKSPYYRPLLCKQTTKNMNFQNLVLNFSLPDLNFQAINYRLLSALDINALRLWFKFQANPSGSFCETVDKFFFTKSIF